MSKILALLLLALLVSSCEKRGTSPAAMGKAYAGGSQTIEDEISGVGDQVTDFAKTGFDKMYETVNQKGRSIGQSMRPAASFMERPAQDKEFIFVISCDGHPVSITRIITSQGEKHFTADTGVECLL